MRSKGQFHRRRRGNAILEMAVVLPMLMFLAMGMAEYGQYMYVANVFESAARDVARFTITSNATQGDPVAAATRTFAAANITFNPSWMTIYDDSLMGSPVITDVSQMTAGNNFRVIIQVPYNQIPSSYRPLFQMTGIGIGSGKMMLGRCGAVKG
jgi:Flp pilus assembly protein TadG